MAQQASLGQPQAPSFLVASISDALSGKPSSNPWLLSKHSSTSTAMGGHASFKPVPASALLVCTATEIHIQKQPQLEGFKLHVGRRPKPGSSQHHPLAAARRIQGFMQAQGMQTSKMVFSALNHHLLPLLTQMWVVQHNAMGQLSERIRNWRPRMRQRYSCEHVEGISSILQTTGPRPPRNAQRLYESARQLERQLDPLAAADMFLTAAEADARQSEWLSLAAKNYSDATYAPGVDGVTAMKYNQKAVSIATQALNMSPDAAHAYIARCVSKGRLALMCDNKVKVQLAKEACDDAEQALQLEPRNDYAHHLKGRWHYEMAGLNPMARTLVRLLFGTSLMAGSYTVALEHYRTACQLAPKTLVHRVELGRTLARLGQHDDAVKELQHAVQLPIDDLNAHLQKIDAEKLLSKLIANPGASVRVLAQHTAEVAAVPIAKN